MADDRGKRTMVVEEGRSNRIDSSVILSVKKLREVQDELEQVDREATDKVLEVEQKYNVIRKPVYVKRSEIIKSIPDFWFIAFVSHPVLGDLLNEEDSKVFKYLDSLDVEDFTDFKMRYSITFNFKPNPYFEDTKLTKTFTYIDEGIAKITGTNIKWKDGEGIANGVDHEKKGNKRPPSDESFFSWFSENQERHAVEGLNDEFRVAEIIKEDLWPDPFKYFINEDEEEDEEEDEVDNSDEDMQDANDEDRIEEDDS